MGNDKLLASKIIQITVYQIEDFVQELKEAGINKVFRHATTGGTAKYSGFGNGFLIHCTLLIPEIVELNRGSGQLGSGHYHRRDKWAVMDDGSIRLTLGAKPQFTKTLKFLGLSKEDVKSYTSVKVAQMKQLIVKSNPDGEDGEVERTSLEKNDRIEKLHSASWGNVTEIKVLLKLEKPNYSDSAISYSISIEDWASKRAEILARHEIPLTTADLRIIDGEVSFVS